MRLWHSSYNRPTVFVVFSSPDEGLKFWVDFTKIPAAFWGSESYGILIIYRRTFPMNGDTLIGDEENGCIIKLTTPAGVMIIITDNICQYLIETYKYNISLPNLYNDLPADGFI